MDDAQDSPKLLVRKIDLESAGQFQIAELYGAVRPSLCAYLRRRNLSVEEIDDVVQDAFVRLLSQGPAGLNSTAMRFWLFRVAHNLAMDRHRSLWRFSTGSDMESEAFSSSSAVSNFTPEDSFLRDERWMMIEGNLCKLTVRQQHAISLWMEGHSYREIGYSLESTSHNVEELVRRGFKRLREFLRP